MAAREAGARGVEKTLKDQDYVDFQEFLDGEAEADSDYLTRGRN